LIGGKILEETAADMAKTAYVALTCNI